MAVCHECETEIPEGEEVEEIGAYWHKKCLAGYKTRAGDARMTEAKRKSDTLAKLRKEQEARRKKLRK